MNREPIALVVDDSPTVCKIVQLTLQRVQMKVIIARDGVSALAEASRNDLDIIFLDIILPQMDGYSICHQLRKNKKFVSTPIIMLSGRDGFLDKMRGKLAGATEYLTKPFEAGELIQVVNQYVFTKASGGMSDAFQQRIR